LLVFSDDYERAPEKFFLGFGTFSVQVNGALKEKI